jgi:hypothetical protein
MEQAVEPLLVEGKPSDAELSQHVLKKHTSSRDDRELLAYYELGATFYSAPKQARESSPCPDESLKTKESSQKVTS